jgi:hypothetical protein
MWLAYSCEAADSKVIALNGDLNGLNIFGEGKLMNSFETSRLGIIAPVHCY